MDTKVKWRLVGDIDPAWRWTRVLYAYLHPEAREVLYIGKADGLSSDLRRRWCADDKLKFWRDLERQRGIYSHRVLVGEVHLEAGNRLSQQLLADMESLLIFAVEPWGNIQSKSSRLSRPGLRVHCVGRSWPGPRVLVDRGGAVEWQKE